MSTVCSKLDELMIRRIADEKFNQVAKYIAPMIDVAVTEPFLNQAILLDPQHEEVMVKTVNDVMANSIKASFGAVFDKILQRGEENA